MKIFFRIGAVIFLLFLSSCSYYYSEKSFSTKEKYYKDFNDFAKNKNVEVTLTNDSSFTTLNGSSISNDTLTFNYKNNKLLSGYIPVKNIKEIYYKKNWPGIIPGVIFGALASVAITGIGMNASRSSNSGFFGGGYAWFYGIPVGTIIGGVIGWFIGANYTYQFNI